MIEPEPPDECPMAVDRRAYAEADEIGDKILDDEDDEDEGDAEPAPCTPTLGFHFAASPPPAEALETKNPAQQVLVGESVLYCWPSVGWCVGVIKEANTDRRYKMKGEAINFYIHYEIDDDTSAHVLSLDTSYNGEGVVSWMLLEADE